MPHKPFLAPVSYIIGNVGISKTAQDMVSGNVSHGKSLSTSEVTYTLQVGCRGPGGVDET